MRHLLLRFLSHLWKGTVVFEDDSVVDYSVRFTTLRYRKGPALSLWCEFPLDYDEATGVMRIDFKNMPAVRWAKPDDRPLTEDEKTDLNDKIVRFVEKQGKPFLLVSN